MTTPPVDHRAPLLAPKATQTQDSIATERKRTMLPRMVAFIFLLEVSVIAHAYFANAVAGRDALVLFVAPALQISWASWIMRQGNGDRYYFANSQRFLESFPIYWFPLVSTTLTMSVFAASMDKLMQVVDAQSMRPFLFLQALRALAVGGLIKWYHGLFPTVFAWAVGFPDMLFGLSAVFLLPKDKAWFVQHDTFFFWWNIIGFAVFVPFGISMLQIGMKPTELIKSRVPNSVVFEYPMILAPGVVVPIALCWNLVLAKWAQNQA